MKKWSGWRSEYAKEKYDVIIIGSGMSGLTAGVLLARHGKKVLIIEKHFKAGGWTHTFKRNNYEWDVGIHYIGEVHSKRSPIRKLFDLVSNGDLEWNTHLEKMDIDVNSAKKIWEDAINLIRGPCPVPGVSARKICEWCKDFTYP